jgi:site-specific recombinase XerD
LDETIRKQFIAWLVGRKSVRPSTAYTYANQVKLFARKVNLNQASNADVVQFLADMRLLDQKNANTRRLMKTGLERFFEFYGPIAGIPDPTRGLEPIKKYRAFPKLVHPDEVERMCFMEHRKGTEISMRNAAIIAFLAMTGVRIGEFERIKLGNVDRKKDHFTLLIPSQKSTYDRQIQFGKFIPGSLVDYFMRYYIWLHAEKKQNKSNPLFFKMKFRHLCQEDVTAPILRGPVDYLLKRAAYNTGIDRRITVHQFRHFYGTYSIVEGMNPLVLQQNMGHAKFETTQQYIHIAGLLTNDTLKHSATANIRSAPELKGYTELMINTFKSKKNE